MLFLFVAIAWLQKMSSMGCVDNFYGTFVMVNTFMLYVTLFIGNPHPLSLFGKVQLAHLFSS